MILMLDGDKLIRMSKWKINRVSLLENLFTFVREVSLSIYGAFIITKELVANVKEFCF